MLSIAEGQHGDLGAGHALLDDDLGPSLAKAVIAHHGADGILGLLHGLGHNDTLAQSQTVSLDHDRGALSFHIGQSGVHVGKGLIFGGGDVVLLHQVLGEDLAGLNDGGVRGGAEGRDTRRLHGVHHAQSQGIIGGYHHKIHGVALGPLHHAVHVGGGDGNALGDGFNAAVAGGAVEPGDMGALGQLPADGVLPPASAYD